MPLTFTTLSAPASTSFNNLVHSTTTAFASCAAITTSTDKNVVSALVRVRVSVGAITPSVSTMVVIYAVGSEDGTTWPGANSSPEVFTSADEANTLSSTSNNLVFLGTINCHTASRIYNSQPLDIAAAFGSMPKAYKIVIQNQTGQALGASNNTVSVTESSY